LSTLETTNAYLQRCHGVPPLPKGWIYSVDVQRDIKEEYFSAYSEETYSKTVARIVVSIWDANGRRSAVQMEREEKYLKMYPWSLDADLVKAAKQAYNESFPKPDTPRLTTLEELLHGD
jgi:hypothetical protein